MRSALVLGAGGFIGHHMVSRLKREGYWVRGVDLKKPSFSKTSADEFFNKDLTFDSVYKDLLYIDGEPFNEIYQYAADMGGAGYIFSGENDANVMTNSCLINLNLLKNPSSCKQPIWRIRILQKSFTRALLVSTLNTIKLTLRILTVRNLQPILQTRTLSMVGRKLFSERLIFFLSKKL